VQNIATIKWTKQYTKKKTPSFKVHLLEQESIRTLYRNRLKGKLTPLTREIDADWLKIKEAITKAAEESIGYKKWKNRRWLRTWNDEIQRAIEEKKSSYRKYLQHKTVKHYIEYKRHRAIVRKMTRRQRREDWDKFVKTLERDITGTQRRGFKIINPLNPELNPICYLLALLGAHHFLHVSRTRVKLLTFRLLMSYIYGAPILDISRSHTTTHHSR